MRAGDVVAAGAEVSVVLRAEPKAGLLLKKIEDDDENEDDYDFTK